MISGCAIGGQGCAHRWTTAQYIVASICEAITITLPQESPLWDLDNVIISPHNAGATPENWEARRQVLRENLRRFLADEPFLYVVDKKAGF